MKLTLSHRVAADRVRVFAALVDPDVLRLCIPGCDTLAPAGPDEYAATLKVGVAGLKGTYSGTAAVRDKQPPDSLIISFEVKGSPGFVRGSAVMRLSIERDDTRVDTEADVQVGGLIAAVGSRLVEAAAKKLCDDFFRQLSIELQRAEPLG